MEHFHIWKKEENYAYDKISHFNQFIPLLLLIIKGITFEINSLKFHFTAW